MWKIKKEEKTMFQKSRTLQLPRLASNSTLRRVHTRPLEALEVNSNTLASLQARKQEFMLRSSGNEVSRRGTISNYTPFKNLARMQKKKEKVSRQNEIVNLFPQFVAKTFKMEIPDDLMFKSAFFNTYPLQYLPNFCFDSPFIIPREGSCLVNLDGTIYLIGGARRRKIGYTNREEKNLDILFHCYKEGKWVREQIEQEAPMECRNIVWHTVDAINQQIVIVGGVVGDSQRSMSALNTDIIMYCPSKKLITKHAANIAVRSHASTTFGNILMIHGGITTEGAITDRLHILNFKEDSCFKVLCINSGSPLAHHKMVNTLNMPKADQANLGSRGGIYMFGGMSLDGKMNNRVKILRPAMLEVDKLHSLKFEDVETKGVAPCPRAHHSLNIIHKKMSLVLIGGIGVDEQPLADVWLLDLLDYRWSQVQTNPHLDLHCGSISKHSAVSDGCRVLVYGGQCSADQGIRNFLQIKLEDEVKDGARKKTKKEGALWSVEPSAVKISSEVMSEQEDQWDFRNDRAEQN